MRTIGSQDLGAAPWCGRSPWGPAISASRRRFAARPDPGTGAASIFARAATAFLALPGTVAFLVPLIWAWLARLPPRWPLGLVLVALGTLALLWCVRDFYVSGKGTLAPWAPPQELVVVGLYRYSRNPMYLAVTVVLLGWALTFRSAGLLLYALAVAIAFHLRVVLGEEPWLARRHGAAWQQYTCRVGRWF